jgi:hypothetical protein
LIPCTCDFQWVMYTYLHPWLGADEVMGSHGSLINDICDDKCDGLTLCEQLLEGYDCTHGYVTFELLLLGFLCCFIDI